MSAPFDHHVHAVLSGDSDVPLEERARTARGPRPHGISEHFPSPHLRTDDDVLRYVERAKRLGLRVSLEYDLGIAPALRPSTRDALDYLVGGIHQVTVRGREISYDDAGEYLKRRVATYASAHLFAGSDDLSRGVLEAIIGVLTASFERDRVDILAHPTFSPIAALGEVESGYPAEWQDRVIGLCVAARVVLEVNESYRVPHAAFVARARDRGARFSVGSDSHAELLPLEYTTALIRAERIADRLLEPSPQDVSGSSARSS